MKLKILHTNDLHSRFEEFARIASAIEEHRDENTLILDAGDNADFSRLETEGTNGRISPPFSTEWDTLLESLETMRVSQEKKTPGLQRKPQIAR